MSEQPPDAYEPAAGTPVPQGYLPPPSAYLPAPGYAPIPGQGSAWDDPLIPPPNQGVNGWFNRVGGVLKHSWQQIAAIVGITTVAPLMVFAILGVLGTVAAQRWVADSIVLPGDPGFDPDRARTDDIFGLDGVSAGVIVAVVLGAIVVILGLYLLQMVGYGASTYTIVRQAIGQPVTLGQSLSYGLRRSLGLLGWNMVVGLIVGLGLVACVLPGIYFYAATALVGPIFLFERASPIGRSFSILSNNFGRILGRLALILALIIIGGGIVSNIIESIIQAVSSPAAATTTTATVTAAAIVAAIVGVIVQVPITVIQIVAVLVTYTEQRGHEGATTARLAHELD